MKHIKNSITIVCLVGLILLEIFIFPKSIKPFSEFENGYSLKFIDTIIMHVLVVILFIVLIYYLKEKLLLFITALSIGIYNIGLSVYWFVAIPPYKVYGNDNIYADYSIRDTRNFIANFIVGTILLLFCVFLMIKLRKGKDIIGIKKRF